MTNELSKKYTAWSLIRFALPTIVMMECMALYSMVDGVFVARLIGPKALAAVNIVYPVLNIVYGIGIMFATGGSAVIAKKMGEGRDREAKEDFTFLVIVSIATGAVMSALCLCFIDSIIHWLGADESIFSFSRDYAFVILFFIPMTIAQMLMQFFFITAGKPSFGLVVVLLGGATNIVLDYVFIALFGWGMSGAALATGIGFSASSIFGLIYFSLQRKGTLCFVRPKINRGVFFHSCVNGSSEMVSNLSAAVITYLYNITMMRLLGANGVAALTLALYADFILVAAFIGYSSGIAPVVGYKYGNKDTKQLREIFRISMVSIAVFSVLVCITALLSTRQIAAIFVPSDSEVYAIAVNGFYLYAFGFLFIGINIFASAFFTALSNGVVSAVISFLRTFVFMTASILILPMFLNVKGIWLSMPVAEILGVFVSLGFLYALKSKYRYA